jgi:hypothetical protein
LSPRARALAAAAAGALAAAALWASRRPAAPASAFRLEEYRRLRAAGESVFPRWAPVQLLGGRGGLWTGPVFPLAGASRREVLFCREGGPLRRYRSDEHGFNNPEGAHRAARLVLLGDSHVEGFCVPREAGLGARLGGLSLGIGGAGPLTELGLLREFAAPLRPPVVVWFYYPNDLADLALERRRPELAGYLRGATQGLRGRQAEVDAAWERFTEAALASAHPAPPPDGAAPAEASVAELGEVLKAADAAVRGWGGRLHFVYLPEWSQLRGPRRDDPRRAELLALARGLGLPAHDAREAFAAHPDPASLFAFDGNSHYSERGYALAAETVASGLARR